MIHIDGRKAGRVMTGATVGRCMEGIVLTVASCGYAVVTAHTGSIDFAMINPVRRRKGHRVMTGLTLI
jgi:hypothetical protein